MSTKQWLAVAAWAFMPFAVTAQEKQNLPNPLDADAPVAGVRYESAFKSFRSPSENQAPDKVWRTANDEMGKLGGHMGHMKSRGAETSTSAGTGNAPAASGAADHSKHH